jgi:hypothetical protein
LSTTERLRLAAAHEPKASASPDGFRLASCVVSEAPMIEMRHLWVDADLPDGRRLVKEIHLCARCATDVYGAPYHGETRLHYGRILHGDA